MTSTNIPSTDTESVASFCRLLREGRLYEAQVWLIAGKPAQCDHRNVRCTPLGKAVASARLQFASTGFSQRRKLARLVLRSKWLKYFTGLQGTNRFPADIRGYPRLSGG
jgi:hypothetical protein